jgi:hypothetical protein
MRHAGFRFERAHLMFAIAYAIVALVVVFAHSGTPVPGVQRSDTAKGPAGATAAVVRGFGK